MNTNTTTNTTAAKKPVIDATITFPRKAEGEGADIGEGVLSLEFQDGRNITLDSANLSDNIVRHAIMHGLKQKLVDAAAISRDPETGRAATIDTKFAAVEEVYNRLLNGEWNKRREAGAGGAGGLLFRALVRKYDGRKTPEQLREWLDSKTDAQQAAMRKDPDIARIIEDIRAEKGEGISSAELFSELDGDEGSAE